jgi:predicted amidohydrolase
VKVAAIQFQPEFRQKRRNLRRLARLVIEAAKSGAKLIVMPEMATTGYTLMSKAAAEEEAEVVTEFKGVSSGTTMGAMYTLASGFDVHLVWGMVEMDYGSGKLYNSQVYLEPNGYFESYRKINRWASDYLWATPGKANPPVITAEGLGGLRVGLLICRDVRDKVNEKWTSLYSPGDADVVCFSANFGKGGFPAVSWMDFVESNRVNLIVSNRYGQEGPNDFGYGGVCVITKDGEVHCEGLVWEQDCIVYAEI